MKNFETKATSKEIKKTKEEIMKQLKESIMNDENVNKYIQESARKVKIQKKEQNLSKKWRKPLKVINVVSYG